jgi:TonB family protein
MSPIRPAVLAIALAGMLGAGALRAQTPAAPPAGDGLAHGLALLGSRQYREAAAELERTDALAGGRSADAKVALARAYTGLGAREKALAAAQAAVALAPPATLLAQAYNQLAVASLLDAKGDLDYAAAEAALRQAAALEDGAVVRLNLAAVLAKRGRTDESVAEARRSIAQGAEGPVEKEARILVCRHRKAAPPPGAQPSPAADPIDLGEPAKPPGGVSRPKILFRVNPYFPTGARNGIAPREKLATVIAETTIDAEGCVTAVRILRSTRPDFAKAAVAAFEKWVFHPAIYEGKPVAVYYALTASFQVD